MNIIAENSLTAQKLWQEHAEFVESMPEHLCVYAGTVYNLRCAMCLQHGAPKATLVPSGPKFFDLALLDSLSVPFSKATFLEFHGTCEPFITKRFWELVEFAQKCSSDTTTRRVCILTNGNYEPTEKILELATGDSIRKITFSVDASHENTYKFIRDGNFSLLLKTMKAIVKKRNLKSLKNDIKIWSTFVMMRSNINEILDHVKMMSALGIDTIEISSLIRPDKDLLDSWVVKRNLGRSFIYKDEMNIDSKKVKVIIENAQSIAQKYGINLIYSGILFGQLIKSQPSKCWWPYKSAFISTAGEVFPCCYNMSSPMGSLKKNTFSAIWNNNLYRQMRRDMAQDRLPIMCQGRNCPFSG